MKFTTLIEDHSQTGFEHEHGLSFWIEMDGKNYLLDSGMTSLFMENAKRLHLDISHPHHCILSHGHNDHGGGFKEYVQKYPNSKIWMKEEALIPHWSTSHNHLHDISIDPSLRKHSQFFKKIEKLEENVYLFSDSPIVIKNSNLYKKINDQLIPDDFDHECSLVFKTEKGLVIFNSCSHTRLKNIIDPIQKYFKQPIYAYIGGLHLKDMQLDGEDYANLTKYIQENIKILYTGHCTGEEACLQLPVHRLQIGKTISL